MVNYEKSGRRPSSGGAGIVSLNKRGDAVKLTKDVGGQPFRFNLNWNARPQQSGGGFFKRMMATGIDLDLGCLYELTDGERGVVQALGNTFGSLDRSPYIQLDKDDRSGNATEGENLLISSRHQDRIKRMVVFAFIYEGVANWSEADGVATIHQPGGPPITIRLDEHRNGQIMCAIATLTKGAGGMQLTREVQYFNGHDKLDRAYDFGLQWSPSRK